MEDNKPAQSVQTVLTISNTDIVTMLMVQQKKLLEDKIPGLKASLSAIENVYQKMVEDVLNKRVAESGVILSLREAITTLHKVYNPNIEFRVDFDQTVASTASCIIQRVFNRGFHAYSINCPDNQANPVIVVEELPCLSVYVGPLGMDEEKVNILEDQFHFVNEENCYEVPHNHKDIIAIKKDDVELWRKIAAQIVEISHLLRDDTKMKEQIVAKMTEKAISANVELQAIVGDILLLE